MFNLAGYGEYLGSLCGLSTDGCIPLCTLIDDVTNVGKCLNVIDVCRVLPETFDCRKGRGVDGACPVRLQ